MSADQHISNRGTKDAFVTCMTAGKKSFQHKTLMALDAAIAACQPTGELAAAAAAVAINELQAALREPMACGHPKACLRTVPRPTANTACAREKALVAAAHELPSATSNFTRAA